MIQEKNCLFVLLRELTNIITACGGSAPPEEQEFVIQKSFHRVHGDPFLDFTFGTSKANRKTVFIADIQAIRKDFARYLTDFSGRCCLFLLRAG